MELFKPMDELDKNDQSKAEKKEKGESEHIKCLILGSGPAGYTAAIYAARANLNPVLYEGMEPGGQLTTTTDVENYPGYPDGVQGPAMMEEFKKQAERFGTDCRWGMATAVDFSKRPFRVTIDDKNDILADSVILATGATAKYLGLESEEKFMGHGVSACATCDGFFYKGKDVVVVGGGDTAAEEALYLSGLCKKVYVIHRRDELRASKIMQKRLFKAENVEIVWDSVVKEIVGGQSVNGVIVENVKSGEEKKLDVDGYFVAIGHKPNSDIFRGFIDMDEVGYIHTDGVSTRTNVAGIFACGDLMDSTYRQAVTAAGTGCKAAIDAERWLAEQEMQ